MARDGFDYNAFDTKIHGGKVNPRIAFLFANQSTTIAITTASKPVVINSITYNPNGLITDFGDLSEDLFFDGITYEVTLNYTNPVDDLVSNSTTLTVYLFTVDDAEEINSGAYKMFYGTFYSCNSNFSPSDAEITMTFTNFNQERFNNDKKLFNANSQARFYPNDKGFEYVNQLSESYTGLWGNTKTT